MDLQLPKQPEYIPPIIYTAVTTTETEPPVKKFKEKEITGLGKDIEESISSAFKKRKIGNKNARKRLDDD